MRGKPIVYEKTATGCIVPTSHKLNKDGYFRTRDDRFTGRRLSVQVCILVNSLGLVSRQPVSGYVNGDMGGFENGRCRDYLLAGVGRWGEIPHQLEAQGTVDHVPL